METNNLIYKTSKIAKNGDQYLIEISLNDEYKNGHQDFSITGEVYLPGKPKTENNMICCGAIGDEISTEFVEFSLFNQLHLCDVNGAPMYAVPNGFYHVKRMSEIGFMSYFRCTKEEYDMLSTSEDEIHFKGILYFSDIPKRWKEQANEAIEILEKLTGKTFINDSVKSHFISLTENEKIDFIKKVEDGYYSEENINERKLQKIETELKKEKEKIILERDRIIEKATFEHTVKLAVLNAGLPLSNFIFYDHNKTGVFNWLESREKISMSEFDEFQKKVNIQGVTFELK